MHPYRRWMETIQKYYGSLDAFSDVTTVRYFLRVLQNEKAEMDAMDLLLVNFETTTLENTVWWELTAADRVLLATAIPELEAWFAKRGLEI